MALPDALLRLAATQHGVITRWQLRAHNVSSDAIGNELRRGRLSVAHRAVYLIPFLDDPRTADTALIFSFGPHAVASYRTGSGLHCVLPHVPGAITVTVTRGHPRDREGARVVRAGLQPDELTVCDGVPATSIERTLLDIASIESARVVEQAVAAALRMNLTTESSLQRLLDRYPRRPGTPRLRLILAAPAEPAFTRSEAEDKFLRMIRRAQLPAPAVNAFFDGYELDFFWKTHRLVVEIDGAAFHSSPQAQTRDRRRDTALAAAGLRVIRFSWHDLTSKPEATITSVALAIARNGIASV